MERVMTVIAGVGWRRTGETNSDEPKLIFTEKGK
jgi:hypothetical protein